MSEPNASAIPASRAASRSRTHKLTVTAMLSAVAFLLMFIEFPIPALIPAFVKLDVSDLPELLAAFSLGPVYGVAVALLKNLLFLVLHGTSSAYVGEVFNFIMGGVFAFSAGFVYQRNKSRKGALLGAVIGAVLMSLLSVPLNYYVVYPAYVVCYKLPLDAIVGMYQAIRPSANGLLECLVTFNMPFTFFKGMLDVAPVLPGLQASLSSAAQVSQSCTSILINRCGPFRGRTGFLYAARQSQLYLIYSLPFIIT